MARMSGLAVLVFSDLVDSTALLAKLGDDRMEAVRKAHVDDVTAVVDIAGGRVVKTLGDGVMASFESALGALRAAAGIQAGVERLDGANGQIGIAARVGIAAGEPIADGDDLHGMTVVIASRLSSAAATGEVLVQDLVQALVASRDGVALEAARDYELKGVPAPVRASALLWRGLLEPESAEEGRALDASAPRIRLPPALAAFAEEPLIGRDREIATLREATAPRAGRHAVMVLGEPGIGKTRHAAAAAAAAHAEGATVVLARCPPEVVIPFEPWVRAIGELAIGGDEEWRQELADAAGPELAALVPELSEHAPVAEGADAGRVVAAEGARYRLLRGIGAAMACAAADAPLYVVLDDAHWCDPASAQALRHMLESPPSAQLALVVTARDRELGRGHPVSRVLSDLRRTGDLSELRLAGLDVSGLAALVGARTGRAITPGLAERLRARTAGNPFFVAELARDLDGQDALREGQALEAAPVPDAVADLVEERLARLDPATERLLEAVAAIGPSAPVDLAAAAAGLDPEAAERAVREALSERLVDDVVASRATISFPHALVREALIAGTGDAARARLHLAIAGVLEDDPETEPADLARHYGLAVELTGPGPAIAAYRAAHAAAAAGHDHEQAAAHMGSVLSLLGGDERGGRAAALLELGEQELLCADLVRAREHFLAAAEIARAVGDAGTLARAALGAAGGDIGFGWEAGPPDAATVPLLREGLEALGDSEPLLALRMIFRLGYLLLFVDDARVLAALGERSEALEKRLGSAEAKVLAKVIALLLRAARHPGFPDVRDMPETTLTLLDLECEREDLRFRLVQLSISAYYRLGRIPECERAIEQAEEIAARLGSPRFTWEAYTNRAMRLIDRGDREGGRELFRRSGAILRRLRPDIHIYVELVGMMMIEWVFDGETARNRAVFEAIEAGAPAGAAPAGAASAYIAFMVAADGDFETAQRRLSELLSDDLGPLRHPDLHVPASLCALAVTATMVGDREAGARLRRLLEPWRPYVLQVIPALSFGYIPGWCIGRLELLAGRPAAAVEELRAAVARADELGGVLMRGWARVDLAVALHRTGETERAETALAEGEAVARQFGLGWVEKCAVRARAEIDGRELPAAKPTTVRNRPLRGLATRGGRRALAAMASGLDDAELERRFADPRRQRALLKATARGFQPAQADGFNGTIAYEIEPYAIEPPADAPWRWAIEVDSPAGIARLVEPAPLDAAMTIHVGLADWVRIAAGIEDALTAMVAGRCSVEGDIVLAVRLEAMFGAR
jgi:class 3 adenylate cyclase/tetratricopeptide (TPR) repeat protein